MANKFMRTFTSQVEALAKLRRGGEQIVKHVYVQEGGQAVIAGTVNTGGGVTLKDANNLMEPKQLREALRCLAKTRRDTECQSPRCRTDGAAFTGVSRRELPRATEMRGSMA